MPDRSKSSSPRGHRKIELARGAWGLAGLVVPRRVLASAGGDPDDQTSRVVMRVLGVRQVGQAVLSGVSPSPAVLALGVWVDSVHALTALGLAVFRRPYAAPALVDAAIASAWAAFGVDDLRSGGRHDDEQLRSRLARDVLGLVPGGAALRQAAGPAQR